MCNENKGWESLNNLWIPSLSVGIKADISVENRVACFLFLLPSLRQNQTKKSRNQVFSSKNLTCAAALKKLIILGIKTVGLLIYYCFFRLLCLILRHCSLCVFPLWIFACLDAFVTSVHDSSLVVLAMSNSLQVSSM